jgi:hypothetical protein
MTRFKVNYQTGTWTIDAVWPNISAGQKTGWGYHGIGYPKIVNVNGRKYMTFGRGYTVYRFAGDQLLASASIIRETVKQQTNYYLWRDTNGDGLVQEAEYRDQPLDRPKGVFGYWGDDWQSDLSLIAIGEGTRDIWRLAPTGFDTYGNPIFNGWQKILTDPVMIAKATGVADLIHGGNEVANVFNASWRSVVGTPQTGFLVDARGLNKVRGQPFAIHEIVNAVKALLRGELQDDHAFASRFDGASERVATAPGVGPAIETGILQADADGG